MGSLFHTYYTSRVVGIENKNLGILYYTLVTLIISYVAYNIIASKAYLDFDPPVGAAELKLKWAQGVIDTTELEYCNTELAGGDGCVVWDKYQVGLHRGDKSMLIVTKVKEVHEKRMCPRGATRCAVPGIWKEVNKTNYFVAGVEQTVLNLEHSFVSPLFFEESGHNPMYSRDNKDMKGVFIRGHGSNSSIAQRFETGKIDAISFSTLLEAAEITSLDVPTDMIGEDNKNKTLRESGFYLYLDIHYNNVRCDRSWNCAFGTVEPTYRYRASMVPQEVHVTKIASENDEEGTRVRLVYYGMLITVKQAGKIGMFSVSALMLQIVGGLGMLAISTAVVDTLATYLLPYHRQFGVAKYSMKNLDQVLLLEEKLKQEELTKANERRKKQ